MTDLSVSTVRPLVRSDYRTLGLAALGGALEFYDFIIFVYFVAVLGQLFFPPGVPDWLVQFQAFAIFAAGYLARPLGGIIIAHFGDMLGRKRMFTLSIFLMAVSTIGMGLLPVYESIGLVAPILLLLFRVAQGAAIGGELPGSWTFVAEHVPERHIGYACGILTCGITSGILLGSLVATAINSVYSQPEIHDFAWRIPFILGGVFGFVSVYLRRWLEETPVFAELQARKALAEELPLKSVIRDHKGGIVISMLLTWLLSAAIVVAILMTPTFLQKQYGFTPLEALEANSAATLFLSIGCVLSGAIIDRVGSGWFFTVASVALGVISYAFYTLMFTHPELLLPMYSLLGLATGLIGGVPYVMVKAFPPKVRFSGVSFSYNVAYAVLGGVTPMLVTLMMRTSPLAPAHYLIAVCAIGFATGLYLFRKAD